MKKKIAMWSIVAETTFICSCFILYIWLALQIYWDQAIAGWLEDIRWGILTRLDVLAFHQGSSTELH